MKVWDYEALKKLMDETGLTGEQIAELVRRILAGERISP